MDENASFTPMMEKYLETKKEYQDCILFYRLGDFYEMFFDDAITASKVLELTLTGKDCGRPERAPMCGIPYHAVDGYLNKLVHAGYKVAICEQMEDPKLAKGLVKREVIRIVTPGTNMDVQTMEEGENSYLMGLIYDHGVFGISTVDLTTGDYYVTQAAEQARVLDEINKFQPKEIIVNPEIFSCGIDTDDIRYRTGAMFTKLDDWYYDRTSCEEKLKEHFKTESLSGLGLKDFPAGILAAGAVLNYLIDTQKCGLEHLVRLVPYETGAFMLLDSTTRRNLELTETIRDKQKRGSLLWVLDKTKTAMGARLLRSYVEQPLLDRDAIIERLDAVEELKNDLLVREEIRENLNAVYDLERLAGKISLRSVNPRDFIALKNSLAAVPDLKKLMGQLSSPLLQKLNADIDPMTDVTELIGRAIADDPPLLIREGGFIKEGYNEEVDKLRKAKTDGKTWLAEIEEKEKQETGIKNLRIGFNKVFGYYLEVTNSYKNLVPEAWSRKQTLANAERYITPRLKELEEMITGAEDKLSSLEYALFTEVREQVTGELARLLKTAKALAGVDVFASLANTAEAYRYVRPKINTEGRIQITEGRHPVVERMIKNDMFIANDTLLDMDANRVAVITGPNMAGKSTYMRQTALIVLLSQIGSFVPAKAADIGIVDRIFTRVGASDDLASGQSTFMVEMTEVANILRNATKNSLLILDEIGRGTSTFDGLSIAWAVVEHIANPRMLGAKALFATHYHELTELEGKLDSVNNYCILVKEEGDGIVFLRKIARGGADKSYGIQVAKLAGVPASVIRRAGQIAKKLADNDITEKAKKLKAVGESEQLSLFDPDYAPDVSYLAQPTWQAEVTDAVSALDLSRMTPLEALNKLYELQNMIREKS